MATTYTPTEIKTRLNTWLRDSSDRTFTSSEKDEFYIQACRDQYVFKTAIDQTLSVVAGQFNYYFPIVTV